MSILAQPQFVSLKKVLPDNNKNQKKIMKKTQF